MTKNIGIIGAGSWGAALAIHLANKGHNVTLWAFLKEEVTKKKWYGYVTTMDQFASIGRGLNDSNSFIERYSGSNYFRVSPWGVEAITLLISTDFKNETSCVTPQPQENQNDRGKKGYRGYFGTVDRMGGSAGYGEPSPVYGAIGITSWDQNSIILASDENIALRARDSFYIQSGMRPGASKNKTVTENMYGEKNDYAKGYISQFYISGTGLKGEDKDNLGMWHFVNAGGEIAFGARPFTHSDDVLNRSDYSIFTSMNPTDGDWKSCVSSFILA